MKGNNVAVFNFIIQRYIIKSALTFHKMKTLMAAVNTYWIGRFY